MDDRTKKLVEDYFPTVGLEGYLHGSGLEFYVRVGQSDSAPRKFPLDHRLLTRESEKPKLLARLHEIASNYKEGLAAQ